MPNYKQSDLIRRLFSNGQPMSVAKGEILIGNEPEPNGVYFINTGYVKIYSISDNGDEYIHVFYGPGELFPLLWAYLPIETESLYYQTLTDCVVWRISRSWFNSIIMNNLSLSYAISVQLAQQFRLYANRLENLEYKGARERIIYRILFLASRFGTKMENSIIVDMPITHELFANSVNLARESVSREIEKLERKGVIKMTAHHLEILDLDYLTEHISRPMSFGNWNLS